MAKQDPNALIAVKFLRGANPDGVAMGPGIENQKGMPVGTAKIRYAAFESLYRDGKVIPLAKENDLPDAGPIKGVDEAIPPEPPDPRGKRR